MDYKINVDLPKEEISKLAKQAIKEIISQNIQAAMCEIDIMQIIEKEMKSITPSLNKKIDAQIKTFINNCKYKIDDAIRKECKEAVIENIKNKPISGNIYLKINKEFVETDYDY